MKLLAYNYSGNNKVCGKSLGTATELDYNYVVASDLQNPTIRASYSDTVGWEFWKYNYIVLNSTSSAIDFGNRKRCYFVNVEGVKNIARGIWEVPLSLDVLETFKSEILNTTTDVERSSERYNLYLNDTFYNAFAYPRQGCKIFPHGFSEDYTFLLQVCNTLGTAEQSILNIPAAQKV